jgi:hypothetical protein
MINIKQIKKYLKNISTNYLIFNIKYTQKELECINNVKVLNHGNFNHFGKIDIINNNDLNNFFSQVSNSSNINILNNIINKLLYNVTKAYDTEYCWMTIRCTLPNSFFDVPRWHKDGPFFVGSDTIQSKFVTVLKGPGTIFIKKLMLIHGIENVRGGSYTQIELSVEQKNTLQTELRSAQDLCVNCGSNKHFIKDCPVKINNHKKNNNNKQNSCFRCGRQSHYANDCYATTHYKGYDLSEDDDYSDDDSDDSGDDDDIVVCYKCGRQNHYASQCYANNYQKK